jgi:bacillithiol synthase
MDTTAQLIDYNTTGAFSKLVTDYISGNKDLAPFYNHPVSIEGIKAAIAARKQYATNRSLLVEALMVQYKEFAIAAMVKTNIDRLLLPNTFTITTAHQPNIFTGPLYFIYKILHAIKLAEQLTSNIPDCNFVPVYYMGSEDADLDELGHIFIKGEKYRWHTTQTGAVGRMKVDKALVKLIDEIAGQILVQPNGAAIIAIMKACYQEGVTIEQATFKLVNELFKDYGLVVLLPDTPLLKKAFIPVIEKELNEGFSYKAVNETAALFPATYKVQASGREINLFYLLDDKRERIEKTTTGFSVNNTTLQYTAKEICTELINHPERFSPNVILRPVFQEVILPNIAFIGGGGELAYWMELKKVFLATGVPYPVLILRNSFLFVDAAQADLAARLKLSKENLFVDESELLNNLVKNETTLQLSLEKEKAALQQVYDQLKKVSGAVDITLAKHTEALFVKAFKKVETLEKKMLRAEKKKFELQQRQLHQLKSGLFPGNNLQERMDNLIAYYGNYGADFIKMMYAHSNALEQQFSVVTLNKRVPDNK